MNNDTVPVNFREGRRTKAGLLPLENNRVIPCATGQEESILGCCILLPLEYLPRCIEALTPGRDAFYDLRNQEIWVTLVEMYDASEPIDQGTVFQKLKDTKRLEGAGGISRLAGLADSAVPANIEYGLGVIQDKWRRRRIIVTAESVLEAAYNNGDTNAALDSIAADIASLDTDDGDKLSQPASYVRQYIDALDARFMLQGKLPGMATGLLDFDNEEGGLRFKEMLVIGARPFEGKTALAVNVVEQVCLKDEQPTLFLSLEMTQEKLMDRFTALISGVSIRSLSKARFTDGDLDKIQSATIRVRKAPLHIVERPGGMSSAEAASMIRRYARQHGVKLVVIDYLQKLTSVGRFDKNTYGIGDTCKRIRHAIVQSGVAGVALAQLNREQDKAAKKRPPRMSDLADSKAIEAEADTIALINRDGDNRNLLIPKSRNSGGSTIRLLFDPDSLRFKNIVRDSLAADYQGSFQND